LSRAIGIRPQPDQVADELAIRSLAYAFCDAANRRDTVEFELVWDENGIWEIGAPLHSVATGATEITAHLLELLKPFEFFVQQVHSGVVAIHGNSATARWWVQETARALGGQPYDNHAIYEDELVKRDGTWRFTRRSYRYVWLDLKSPIGGQAVK